MHGNTTERGRQANRYASESIFARYTTVLYSECIPRHTGMHEHTLALTLCPPLATLMSHDSQWLPRSATDYVTTRTRTSKSLLFLPKLPFRPRPPTGKPGSLFSFCPGRSWSRCHPRFPRYFPLSRYIPFSTGQSGLIRLHRQLIFRDFLRLARKRFSFRVLGDKFLLELDLSILARDIERRMSEISSRRHSNKSRFQPCCFRCYGGGRVKVVKSFSELNWARIGDTRFLPGCSTP